MEQRVTFAIALADGPFGAALGGVAAVVGLLAAPSQPLRRESPVVTAPKS